MPSLDLLGNPIADDPPPVKAITPPPPIVEKTTMDFQPRPFETWREGNVTTIYHTDSL